MSTTPVAAVEAAPVEDLTPVEIPAASLESLSPAYLRELKSDLAARGEVPAVVSASGAFEEDCSLATQSEADDLREYARAAAYLGASRLEVEVETAADPSKVEPALAACAERARREGVELTVTGPVDLDAE